MYALISFSHKKLDITLREKIAFPQDELQGFYQEIFDLSGQIQECVILSTCNRFEILLFLQDQSPEVLDALVELIGERRQLDLECLREGVSFYWGSQAVEHLFKVASSLDSLVVGETQITGQLKRAYKFSFDHGFCKKALSRIIHFAFKCSALVRNQTQISKNPTSVASVAVAKFMQCQPNKDEKVIVVGTGEIGSLCAKHLLSQGFSIILLSAHLQSAQALAHELGERAQAAPLSSLFALLSLHPYLFSATGAPHVVITKDITPPKKRCLWFDMALPRDIEDGIEGAEVFVIDDLQEIVDANISKRQEEIDDALQIIQKQTQEFFYWIESLEVEPIIKSLREKAKDCALGEVDRAIKKGFLPQEQKEEVERILHNAFNKFLHTPTLYLKKIRENPESDFILSNIQKLFDLQECGIYENLYKCEELHKG